MSNDRQAPGRALQIDINGYGEIERLYADLRLLAPLAEHAHAPTIAAVLGHREPANILPSGEPARMTGPIDEEPHVWYLDRMELTEEVYYQLRTRGREITIHLRVKNSADASALKNDDVLVNFESHDAALFDAVLDAIAGEPDLSTCLVNMADRLEDWAYTAETAEVVRAVRTFREQREHFFSLLQHTPAPDAERRD